MSRPDDLVFLVVVTSYNHVPMPFRRCDAEGIIRAWVETHNGIAKLSLSPDPEGALAAAIEHLRLILSVGAIASQNANGGMTAAVANQEIVGLYIRENEPTAQERFAEKAAQLTDMQINESKRGEEWKDD